MSGTMRATARPSTAISSARLGSPRSTITRAISPRPPASVVGHRRRGPALPHRGANLGCLEIPTEEGNSRQPGEGNDRLAPVSSPGGSPGFRDATLLPRPVPLAARPALQDVTAQIRSHPGCQGPGTSPALRGRVHDPRFVFDRREDIGERFERAGRSHAGPPVPAPLPGPLRRVRRHVPYRLERRRAR